MQCKFELLRYILQSRKWRVLPVWRFLSVAPCSSSTHSAPGVFYKIIGTGKTTLLALTADYDSQISLFTGDDCGTLTCVGTNDDQFQDLGLGFAVNSGIVEKLEDGQPYFILVDGWLPSDSGNFTLYAEPVKPPENDDCLAAQGLELDAAPVAGSTLAATRDQDLPFCGWCVMGESFSLSYRGFPVAPSH